MVYYSCHIYIYSIHAFLKMLMNSQFDSWEQEIVCRTTMSESITLDKALSDVEIRFLLNLPDSELQQADRLFFQIEQAHWFYEDFIADNNTHLPRFSLKQFAYKLFSHCSIFEKMQDKCYSLFEDFSAYRKKIPVFGCCILNPEMTKVALQCSWNGKSWGWPKGKVNEGEDGLTCGIRETFEETGFDATSHCREDHSISHLEEQKLIKLYIATNVPESTIFEPQTRKEVSKVEFHLIDDLPKSSYGVFQFIPKLKRWISTEGKKIRKTSKLANKDKEICKKERVKSEESLTRNIDDKNVETFDHGETGWDSESMFEVNGKLTGRTYSYDGNPHEFGSTHPRYINYNSQVAVEVGVDLATTFPAAIFQPVTYFSTPFKFDKKDVMKAVEARLDQLDN